MFFKRLTTGMLSSNCYILGDNGEGVVIDPGVDSRDIIQILETQQLSLKYIILTHTHIDHILHMEELRSACGGKVVIHEEDAPLLGNAMLNGAALFGLNMTFGEADLCMKDGDSLFTGDTLFKLGVGRTDLGAGDQTRLMNSLKELMKLDDSLTVYPGHGSATDIGYERKNNMSLWY